MVTRVSQNHVCQSTVIELRQYTLYRGERDTLINLFDAVFIESQEQVGIEVIGQFRDLDDEAKFVWLRGFSDMDERARSLTKFYASSVWKANRDAATATMVDSDDVLLLRPVRSGSGFSLDHSRHNRASDGGERGVVEATILQLESPPMAEALRTFERMIGPLTMASGGRVLAFLVTEASENNYPALPIRQGVNVLAWFSGFTDRVARENYLQYQEDLLRALASVPGSSGVAQVLRLAPTRRSLLHGMSRPSALVG